MTGRSRTEPHTCTDDASPGCEHDWMRRGTDDDPWRECFLCGEQSDASDGSQEPVTSP